MSTKSKLKFILILAVGLAGCTSGEPTPAAPTTTAAVTTGEPIASQPPVATIAVESTAADVSETAVANPSTTLLLAPSETPAEVISLPTIQEFPVPAGS
jgi:hypothetical protein